MPCFIVMVAVRDTFHSDGGYMQHVSGAGTYFFFDGRIPYLQKYTPTINFYLVPIVVSANQWLSWCSMGRNG